MKSDSITRQIQIDADPQRVWDALSDATVFGEWFRVKLDGPFVVGETTTGKMTYPGHEGVPWTSVTEVMEPPKRLVFRWPDCPPGEDAGPDTVWLTVEFTLQRKTAAHWSLSRRRASPPCPKIDAFQCCAITSKAGKSRPSI